MGSSRPWDLAEDGDELSKRMESFIAKQRSLVGEKTTMLRQYHHLVSLMKFSFFPTIASILSLTSSLSTSSIVTFFLAFHD
ncbi:unnamed protein product [Spirodela intermedia]|uniref:Uncharacterized protein n=1 Tax=Spirodela intermedia TaxID=51605 RepID=A0A7I8JSM6_SPIIN|nr:unnamed protein product [Spirodela intermedia]CAA6673178.1 unnamed protein product [Spirodela intermedia]